MPAIRNEKNAALICERLAEGFTLRQIARELNCTAPAITTWVREDDEFSTRYARAMEARWDRMAEEIQEISDEGTNDWMQRELDAGEIVSVPDHEHIQRSKLRVDTRKWLLSKMRPRQFGERTTIAGDPEAPIKHEHTLEARQAEAKAILDGVFGEKAE